jgi:hypothetical protein
MLCFGWGLDAGVMCISRPMSPPRGLYAVIFGTPRARRSKMKGMLLSAVAWFGLSLSFAARDTGAPDALLVHQVAAERELAAALAPVKNRAQLDAYLREHRGASSPFHVLRPAALQRFSGGLVFNDRGVSSYDYTTLQRELTASQIFGILRVFGVEDSVSRIPGLKVRGHADRLVLATLHIRLDGHHDMYCVAHGSCAPRLGWVCTSNC